MPENCVCSFQAFFVRNFNQCMGFIITAGVSMLPVLLCVCSNRGCVSCSIVYVPCVCGQPPSPTCLTDAEGLQPSEASKAVHFRVCPPGVPPAANLGERLSPPCFYPQKSQKWPPPSNRWSENTYQKCLESLVLPHVVHVVVVSRLHDLRDNKSCL